MQTILPYTLYALLFSSVSYIALTGCYMAIFIVDQKIHDLHILAAYQPGTSAILSSKVNGPLAY